MAFTVNDLQDLLKLLREHPEWREEVRREVLGDELLSLPDLVRQNSLDIQKLTERMDQLTERMEQLTQRVDQLTERVDQLTQRVDQLTQRMDQLAGRMDQLTQRMDQLAGRMDQLTEAVGQLVAHARGVDIDLAELKGDSLAVWYHSHPQVLAQRRRLRKIWLPLVANLDLVDEAVESGKLTADQLDALYNLDLLVGGREGTGSDARDALLVVEVSNTIDRHDVSRAVERAELLRSLGYAAYPVVAGRDIDPRTRKRADELGVDVHLRTFRARSA